MSIVAAPPPLKVTGLSHGFHNLTVFASWYLATHKYCFIRWLKSMGWVTFWSKKDSQNLDLNGSGMEKFHATQEFSFMFLVDCQKCTIGCHSTQNWIQVRFFNPMRQLIKQFHVRQQTFCSLSPRLGRFSKKSNSNTCLGKCQIGNVAARKKMWHATDKR